MAGNLRMGLEVEMQDVFMTFWRTDAGRPNATTFWDPPVPPIKVEQTMIQHDPILIPASTAFANLGAVNWDADWGFIVVGDNFGIDNQTITGNPKVYSRCIFELGFAANVIGEAAHWTFARRASKVFYRCLMNFRQGNAAQPNVQTFFQNGKKWYPLADFVAYYNAQIALELKAAGSSLAANKWQLQLSPSMTALHPAVGTQWTPYICVEDTLWTDTQVNYQLDLESLYTNTQVWLDMWKYTWMINIPFIGGTDSDPASGHRTVAPLGPEIVRNQLEVALWKLAKQQTDAFFATPGLLPVVGGAPGNVASATQLNQIKALIMYMLAYGSISPVLSFGTYKGSYSQFAKTSPASIANTINWAGMAAHFTSVAARAAATTAFNNMRNMANIHALMPAGSPFNANGGIQAYNVSNDAIFQLIPANPPAHPNPYAPPFATMWDSTFAQMGNVAVGNNFGYELAAPFNCYWAFAHTAKPATTYGGGNKIRILMESRFSHNRLNIGFNPMCPDPAFFLSYKMILSISDVADKPTIMRWMSDQPPAVVGTQPDRKALEDALAAGQAKGIH